MADPTDDKPASQPSEKEPPALRPMFSMKAPFTEVVPGDPELRAKTRREQMALENRPSDVVLPFARGVEGAVRDIYGLAKALDGVTFDALPEYGPGVFGHQPKGGLGEFVAEATSFMVPYGKVSKVLGKAVKAVPLLGESAKLAEEAKYVRALAIKHTAQGNAELAARTYRQARSLERSALLANGANSTVAGAITEFMVVTGADDPTMAQRGEGAAFQAVLGPATEVGLGVMRRFVRIRRPIGATELIGPDLPAGHPASAEVAEVAERQAAAAEMFAKAEAKAAQKAPGATQAGATSPEPQKPAGGPTEAPGATSAVPGPVQAATASGSRITDTLYKIQPKEVVDRYLERMTNPAADIPAANVGGPGRFNPTDLDEAQRALLLVRENGVNTRWFAGRARGMVEMKRVLHDLASAVTETKPKRGWDAADVDDLRTAADLTNAPEELFSRVFQGPDSAQIREAVSRVRVKKDMQFGISKQIAKAADQAINSGDDLSKLIAYEDYQLGVMLAADTDRAAYELGYGLNSLKTITDPAKFAKARDGFVKRVLKKSDDMAALPNPEENAVLKNVAEAPAETLQGNAEAIAERMNLYGGRSAVEERLKAAAALSNPAIPDAMRAAKLASVMRTSGKLPNLAGGLLNNFYFNILSGARSIERTLWSQGLYGLVLRPAQHAMGGAGGMALATAVGEGESAGQFARQFLQGVGELQYLFHPEAYKQAWQAGLAAFKENEAQLLRGAKKFDDVDRRALGGERFREWFARNGWNPDGVLGVNAQRLGNALSALHAGSGRVYVAVDEATKAVAARQIATTEYALEALFNKGLPLGSIRDYVDTKMSQALVDGHLQTRDAVIGKAYDDAVREAQMFGYTSQATVNEIAERKSAESIRALGEPHFEKMDYIVRRAHEAAATSPFENGTLGQAWSFMARRFAPLSLITPIVRTSWNMLRYSAQPFDALGLARGLVAQSEQAERLFPNAYGWNLKNARNQFVRDLASQNPAIRTEALGRMTLAATMIGSAYALASKRDEDGMPVITGTYPPNPALRKLWVDNKVPERSFRIGGKWVNYGDMLGPVGIGLSTTVDYFDRMSDEHFPITDEEQGAMASALWGSFAANFVKTPSFIFGLSQFLDHLGRDDEAGMMSFLKRTGALAAVPVATSAAVSQLGDAYEGLFGGDDAVMRETRTLFDHIMARIPVLRDELEPVRNGLGEPMEAKHWLFGGIPFPIQVEEQRTNKVDQERFLLGMGDAPPQRDFYGIDLKDLRDESGRSAYDWYGHLTSSEVVGFPPMTLRQRLDAEIAKSSYQLKPWVVDPGVTNPRRVALSQIVERYRANARTRLMEKFPVLRDAQDKARASRKPVFLQPAGR